MWVLGFDDLWFLLIEVGFQDIFLAEVEDGDLGMVMVWDLRGR